MNIHKSLLNLIAFHLKLSCYFGIAIIRVRNNSTSLDVEHVAHSTGYEWERYSTTLGIERGAYSINCRGRYTRPHQALSERLGLSTEGGRCTQRHQTLSMRPVIPTIGRGWSLLGVRLIASTEVHFHDQMVHLLSIPIQVFLFSQLKFVCSLNHVYLTQAPACPWQNILTKIPTWGGQEAINLIHEQWDVGRHPSLPHESHSVKRCGHSYSRGPRGNKSCTNNETWIVTHLYVMRDRSSLIYLTKREPPSQET